MPFNECSGNWRVGLNLKGPQGMKKLMNSYNLQHRRYVSKKSTSDIVQSLLLLNSEHLHHIWLVLMKQSEKLMAPYQGDEKLKFDMLEAEKRKGALAHYGFSALRLLM
ncbi:hypothetical protein Droror1_Dr00028090 [Drosera rotundifolia]